MLDFNNILSTPGMDVQYFTGQSTATLTQWQTWRKPRGVKNIYILGVGGGSSGAVGANAAATNTGGLGGGSGAQTSVWIPAMFVPDVLYVQTGAGGQQPAVLVSAATQVGGVPTYVALEPSTTLTTNMTLLLANGGVSGAVTGGALATIAGMPLAARGYYTFFVGQSGAADGGVGNAGTAVAYPVTGLMVMGGAQGGSGGATATAGGGYTVPAGVPINDFFLPTQTGGTAGAGATPAGAGRAGISVRNYIMNYGGTGGGGGTTTAGGLAGAGGNGAPGSGGGGSGGATTTITTLARPGNGGNGFVIVMSW